MKLPPGATQPFEAINFKAYDSVEATTWRYQAGCVAERGFTVTEQPRYDSGSALLQTADKIGTTTEAVARRNGLHDGLISPADVPGRTRKSQATEDALGQCLTEARSKLGRDTQETIEQFVALTNDMSNAFNTRFNPIRQSLHTEVVRCVVDAGWQPIDPSRVTEPDVPAAELFGVQTASVVSRDGRHDYTPLPREVDLALALANCRVKLKSTDRLLAEAIKLEQPIVDEYEQRIVEVNAKMEDLARRAPEVLR